MATLEICGGSNAYTYLITSALPAAVTLTQNVISISPTNPSDVANVTLWV